MIKESYYYYDYCDVTSVVQHRAISCSQLRLRL